MGVWLKVLIGIFIMALAKMWSDTFSSGLSAGMLIVLLWNIIEEKILKIK